MHYWIDNCSVCELDPVRALIDLSHYYGESENLFFDTFRELNHFLKERGVPARDRQR